MDVGQSNCSRSKYIELDLNINCFLGTRVRNQFSWRRVMKNGSYDVARYFRGSRELKLTAGISKRSAVFIICWNGSKRE